MSEMPNSVELYTIDQTAGLLKVSTVTIREYIKKGELPTLKLGRRVRIKKDDLYNFLESKYKNQKTEDAETAETADAENIKQLTETIKNDIKDNPKTQEFFRRAADEIITANNYPLTREKRAEIMAATAWETLKKTTLFSQVADIKTPFFGEDTTPKLFDIPSLREARDSGEMDTAAPLLLDRYIKGLAYFFEYEKTQQEKRRAVESLESENA